MLNDAMYDLLVLSVRTVILLSLPMVAVIALVGTLVSAIQTSMSLQDSGLTYAARLLACIATLYFMLPACVEHITRLLRAALE